MESRSGCKKSRGDWKSGSEREHIYENRSFLISFGKRSLPKKTFSHYRTQNAHEQQRGEGKSPAHVWAEIKAISEPTPTTIQEMLWDATGDASFWSRTELGRFCDQLNAEFDMPRSWLDDWRKAVSEEKRDRTKREGKSAESHTDSQEFEADITFTEGWTARQFVKQYGQDIRYCALWNKVPYVRWEAMDYRLRRGSSDAHVEAFHSGYVCLSRFNRQ